MATLWLFKEEPTHYSFDQLTKEGRTVWDGVHNNLALKHLRNVRQDDKVLCFHTGKEKAIVSVMRVISDPYPNPEEKDKRFVVVDIEPVRKFKRAIQLSEVKRNPKLKSWDLVRLSRLTVMPVTREQWREIHRLSGG